MLRLILGSAGQAADDAHVADFVHFAARRGIDLAGAWLAEAGGALAWAVLPIVSPGRTMLLLGPGGAPADSPSREAAGALVDAVCDHHGRRRVQLAQVLLDPSDAASQRLHEGRGFCRVAQLIYLQLAPRRKASPPPLPPGLRWVPYAPQTHALFARAVTRTYHQSLDCPQLNGLRDIEDVLAGHKASGEFDPRLWMMLSERGAAPPDASGAPAGHPVGEPAGEPVGVLLLAPMQPGDAVELVYLGLTPRGRGRGLGDVLMRQALALAASRGASRLSLAVDSGNTPALKLYYRHGMQRCGSKLAMMRRLDASDPLHLST